jgi:hypothetical protein
LSRKGILSQPCGARQTNERRISHFALIGVSFNRGPVSFDKIAGMTSKWVPPEQRLPTPEWQMHMQATWAMRTIMATASLANDESLPEFAQIACLEDFFVNVRAMIEFLIRAPNKPNPKDFSALDLVPTWTPKPEDAVARLDDEWWLVASQEVVHFSKERIRYDIEHPRNIDTSYPALERIANDVAAVWNAFASELEQLPHDQLRGILRGR